MSIELVTKIWHPQIIVEADDIDKDLVVAHICDGHGKYLMKYDGTPQESRGLAMDHLIMQLEREYEKITNVEQDSLTSDVNRLSELSI